MSDVLSDGANGSLIDTPSDAAPSASLGVAVDSAPGAAPNAASGQGDAGTCGNAAPRPCGCTGVPDIPDEELLYDLADLFKIFSDTTRIKILYSLMGAELCVADIAEATGSSQSAVSHQLRILKQAHLVKFERDGRSIVYSLADDHVYTMLSVGMSHICE